MINLQLPNNAKGIVIKISGGADSSILYYGLVKYLVENKLDIPLYAVSMDTDRKPWYYHYAKKVVTFTKEEFGIEPVEHRTMFLDSPWTVQDYDSTQHNLMMGVVNQYPINIAYSGLTTNPTYDNMLSFWDHKDLNFQNKQHACEFLDVQDNSRKSFSSHNLVSVNDGYTMIRPFLHSDKRAVARAYKDYGVMDTLFPLTYSCEESDSLLKKELGMVDGFQEHTHCGQCWFCLERVYGFDRII